MLLPNKNAKQDFGDTCGCALLITQLHYYKNMNLGQ